MHLIASVAESALRHHVHPALRLAELVALVAPRVDRTLDQARLRAVLEAYPDRFRLLDPWHGRWATAARWGDHAGPDIDVWVVAIAEPRDPPPGIRAAHKLRESVRWLGRGIDPRSPGEVSRWYAIALAERAVREALVRRAA
jgi:hypothetical protein